MSYPHCPCNQCKSSVQPTYADPNKPEIGGKYYQIINKAAGQAIAYVFNSSPQQSYIALRGRDPRAPEFFWRLQKYNDYFFLVNKLSSTRMSTSPSGQPSYIIDSQNTSYGMWIHEGLQSWKLEDAGDGYFYIKNNNEKFLENSVGDLICYPKSDKDSQRWKFYAIDRIP